MIDKDKLNHLGPKAVAVAALGMLDTVSDHDKEVQATALALTLLAYVRRHGIDVGDVFTVANNILADPRVNEGELRALHLYVTHELS